MEFNFLLNCPNDAYRVVVKIPWKKGPSPTCGSSESPAALEGNTATLAAESESHRGIRSVPRELRSGGGDKKRRNKKRKIEEQPPATASTTTRDLSRCVTVLLWH